jgi:hypothetical protein
VFDRRYYTAAQLGPTGFTDTGNFVARPFDSVDGEFPIRHATFYSPGAPRGVWGGIRLEFRHGLVKKLDTTAENRQDSQDFQD